MSDDAYGATIAKLRLARRLTEMRVDAGYTANHVCDMLNWGRGKVGRFEANQWKRPEMSDIRDLLRFYEADDTCAREIEELAMRPGSGRGGVTTRTSSTTSSPVSSPTPRGSGCSIPLVIPGLLQTA